ncbi:MAG TPA: hypothetical protein PL155_02405 [Candidatus Omnitrophota bacterium]|nr:hypothetical protein [Candidatus Omnitrophota bacterium]HPD84663.1 hypothetical protein [Candidatus Omnitrophota bacterium]HRZ03521.1 hypothetical protein [Candidatus Omnitrophota bacterium]
MQEQGKDKKTEKQSRKRSSKEYEKPCLVKYLKIKNAMAAATTSALLT